MSDVRPARLGKYVIEGELGRGASGIVYLGRDPDLARPVAIKVLSRPARGGEWAARLREEARVLASVSHPNIAHVHSIEEVDAELPGGTFLILTMEWIPGITLARRRQEGPLSLDLCLDYGRQIAAALEAAHVRSVVHRDLKPQNIHITPDGWIKVLDFGLAQLLSTTPSDSRAWTGAGGTPGYMSPEQSRGEAVDFRSDLWSFGAVLYECVTGEPAVRGSGPAEILDANRRGVVDLTLLSGKLPGRVESLLHQCLERDRERRLVSATGARQILEEALLRLRAAAFVSRQAPRGRVPRGPAAMAPRGNLPRPLSSFVGREELLEQLERGLRERRLLTVTGPGGVGKTRISLELARRVVSPYEGGLWFVDLAAVAGPDDVRSAVLRTLRFHQAAGREPEEVALGPVITEAFGGQAALLLLDNCEHVLAGVGRFVGELLDLPSAVTVLATSRQPLGIPGEQVVPLPPMALPREGLDAREAARAESVQLYLQRARSRAPGFEAGERALALIVELCRHLDGLPLAIELAASHARSFALEELLRRVSEGPSLSSRSPASPARHRSLRGLVDWSYRLLSPKERTLLRRLSVFRGGFTLPAAESVCGGSGDVDGWEVCDLLVGLVERSLVEPEFTAGGREEIDGGRSPRYRLLETIRSFAAGRLEEDEEEWNRVALRYLDTLAALVAPGGEEMAPVVEPAFVEQALASPAAAAGGTVRAGGGSSGTGTPQRPGTASPWPTAAPPRGAWTRTSRWFRRLEPDYANLLHGMELALARGRLDVAFALGEQLGESWVQAGQWMDGLRCLERLLCARDAGEPAASTAPGRVEEIRVLGQAGLLAVLLGWLDRAGPLIEEGLVLARELGEPAPLARMHETAGLAAWHRGDWDLSQAHLAESQRLSVKARDWTGAAACIANLGVLESSRGDHESALVHYREYLRLGRAMGDQAAEAKALLNIGWTERTLGSISEARSSLERALAIHESNRDAPGVALAHQNLGDLALSQGDFAQARTHLLEAGRARLRMADRNGLAASLVSLARAADRQSQPILAATVLAGILRPLESGEIPCRPDSLHALRAWKEELRLRLGDGPMAHAVRRGESEDLPALLSRIETAGD
jgi:predicted ATPase/tetratricopeptide (TPR) repeat protein